MNTKDLVIAKIKESLNLATKREAESYLNVVVSAIEQTLLDNLKNPTFQLKLNSLGKFSIRHRPSIYRKISFTGETKQTEAKRKVKFVSLGRLRENEVER